MSLARHSRPSVALLALMVGSTTGLWSAAGSAQQNLEELGQSVPIGESDLYPSLRIEYQQNNNAFLTADDETDASSTLVSPELLWRADQRTLVIEGRYRGDYLLSSEEALDETNHLLGVDVTAELTARQRVAGSVSYQRGNEDIGSELTRGLGEFFDEPAAFNEINTLGRYIYGAEGARGNVEGGVLVQSFSYESLTSDERPELGDITDGRDYTLLQPFGIFSLRISPDTRVLLGVEAGQYTYDEDLRDRQDLTVFTGLSFAATGTLSGEVRLGATTASFDNSDRDDQTDVTARSSLVYRPVDYSIFALTFDRSFDNRTSDDAAGANAEDVLTIEDLLRLDWRYDWSSRFNHRAFGQVRAFDVECPSVDSDVFSAGLELNLFARRWLEFGIGVETASRSSGDACPTGDGEELDYDRQILSAHVRATL